MKRRDFIRTIGAFTALGFTSVGVRQQANAAKAPSVAEPHVHGAIDATPASVEDDFRYRGRRVKVLRRTRRRSGREEAMMTLSIDGKEHGHHVFAQIGDGDGYGSHMLPYQTFRRPRDLARLLIDRDGVFFKL